eukprot:6115216-Pyramimonas_sp.AAC.1
MDRCTCLPGQTPSETSHSAEPQLCRAPMPPLGKVTPPNIDRRFSFLDRAVPVPPEPGGRTSRERGRAKRIAFRHSAALLFPTVT